MKTFKERCIELRKQDKSIIEIMRITGRAKSSIHTHIKDIPLSDNRIKQYKTAAGNRIKKFALARKGKSVRPFKSFEKWNEEMVSLVAHLLFDGGIYPRNGCAYSNRSDVLRQQVEEHMRIVYEFEPVRYQDLVTGVRRISYYNVALAIHMKKKVRYEKHCIGRPCGERAKGSCALPFPRKRKLPNSFARSTLVLLYAFVTKWDVFGVRVY